MNRGITEIEGIVESIYNCGNISQYDVRGDNGDGMLILDVLDNLEGKRVRVTIEELPDGSR